MKPVRAPIDLGTRVLELKPHPTTARSTPSRRTARSCASIPRPARSNGRGAPGTFPADSQTAGALAGRHALRWRLTRTTSCSSRRATWEWFGPAPRTGGQDFYLRAGRQPVRLGPDGRITLFDGTTGTPEASIPLPDQAPEARMTYLPDSSGMLVAGVDGSTWTVDTRT